jgi:hypothetical protein
VPLTCFGLPFFWQRFVTDTVPSGFSPYSAVDWTQPR